MGDKQDHVKARPQTRNHTCHWPDCGKQVPPAMWGCKVHWRKLPLYLRNKIWETYDIGQEESLNVSPEYLAAADAVQKWIRENT